MIPNAMGVREIPSPEGVTRDVRNRDSSVTDSHCTLEDGVIEVAERVPPSREIQYPGFSTPPGRRPHHRTALCWTQSQQQPSRYATVVSEVAGRSGSSREPSFDRKQETRSSVVGRHQSRRACVKSPAAPPAHRRCQGGSMSHLPSPPQPPPDRVVA